MSKRKPKPPTPVEQYFAETLVCFDGQPHSRQEIIAVLQACGGTPGQIDRYLQGLDLRKRLDGGE